MKCPTCDTQMVQSSKDILVNVDTDEVIRKYTFVCPLCERIEVIEK